MKQHHTVIAIPYYNGSRFLRQAIASVVVNWREDMRLVVIDDASEDDPKEILEEFSQFGIDYFRNPERVGMIENHKRCLEFNTGKYFKILSQDDELLPGALDRQISLLDAHPELVFVSGSKQLIDSAGRVLLAINHGLNGRVNRQDVCRAIAIKGTNPVGEPALVLMRGSATRLVRGFPGGQPWLLDILMWLQLLELGPGMVKEEPVGRFRLSSQSYSAGMGLKQVEVFSTFLDDLRINGDIGLGLYCYAWLRCRLNALLRQIIYRWYDVGHGVFRLNFFRK
ncbi:glycosyltransferase family 2 protein [Rugosibacter aromaticivorans]|uniref:glycosyltransferase family 2 protein n=1 Tax=Rugosibacter aromaticivorans TaxID=1565605 RepID=UPI00192A4C46|nr:glycosyltransferase family 2 protein [Rugosibacter aromaticivorans]